MCGPTTVIGPKPIDKKKWYTSCLTPLKILTRSSGIADVREVIIGNYDLAITTDHKYNVGDGGESLAVSIYNVK